jgi:hypothetical protein
MFPSLLIHPGADRADQPLPPRKEQPQPTFTRSAPPHAAELPLRLFGRPPWGTSGAAPKWDFGEGKRPNVTRPLLCSSTLPGLGSLLMLLLMLLPRYSRFPHGPKPAPAQGQSERQARSRGAGWRSEEAKEGG